MTAAAACVHTARLLPEAPTRDLVPLFAERRLAALPADHRLAQQRTLPTADLVDEPHLRYLQTAPVPGVSGLSAGCAASRRKLEHVAAGHGIIVLPLSATRYYSRTDVVYVPVVDAELDQVYLACDGTRRSKLISGFIEVAQRVLVSSESAPARPESAAPM